MRIPKQFSILENTWRVEYKWNLTHNRKSVYGVCDPATRTILIDRSLSKEDKATTFVHEFMHAVLDEYRIGHNSKQIGIAKEERLIETLESELMAKFKVRWRNNDE